VPTRSRDPKITGAIPADKVRFTTPRLLDEFQLLNRFRELPGYTAAAQTFELTDYWFYDEHVVADQWGKFGGYRIAVIGLHWSNAEMFWNAWHEREARKRRQCASRRELWARCEVVAVSKDRFYLNAVTGEPVRWLMKLHDVKEAA